jgi:hypothetical protein
MHWLAGLEIVYLKTRPISQAGQKAWQMLTVLARVQM